MGSTINALKKYLFDVLGLKVNLSPWKKKRELSFFLAASYDLYAITLLKQPCILVIAKEGTESTPSLVKKHLEQIHLQETNTVCIFIDKTITSYNRNRFIAHQIPFIIPGNQLYLPEFGFDLREYFRKSKENKKSFSPATQAVLIHVLLDQKNKTFTPSKLSEELNYTLMTMSRAFDELENVGIGQFIRQGKERLLLIEESKRELWEKTKPLMRSPVKKRVWIKGKQLKLQAGLTALAEKSLLAFPSTPVYALSLEEWKELKVVELPDREDAAFELEIWYYDPTLFAKKGCVDPFSLYLSLYETEDERIEAALEEMMEQIKW